MRNFNPDHVYTTDMLITSIAVRLGRPVALETVETYRGMANVGERGTDSERCLTLTEAVEHIVSSPWQRAMVQF